MAEPNLTCTHAEQVMPILPELGLTKRESAEGQLMAELRAEWEHERAPESRKRRTRREARSAREPEREQGKGGTTE